MTATPIETKNLKLVPQTREQARVSIDQMPPEQRAYVSSAWLARLEGSSEMDPWIHGFVVVDRTTECPIGRGGFKGPPTDNAVEIAYGIDPDHQGKGYATEAAAALASYAFTHGKVDVVCAHTLPEPNASTRVLTKCGFRQVGEVIDPEDGRVWRWEKRPDVGQKSST